MIDLFIVAGELSGDQLGASLLEEIYKEAPNLRVGGVHGPSMRRVGAAYQMSTIYPMEQLQTMGFVGLLGSLPRLIFLWHKTVDAILSLSPSLLVTIDYPGFNLRLGKAVRKRGFKGKICHYVSPSIWAWGKKRVEMVASYLDRLLVLFPFEPDYFTHTPISVEYVGHPLVCQLECKKREEEPLVLFFPGSRLKEIERTMPLFLQLHKRLRALFPHLEYALSLSHETNRAKLKELADEIPLIKAEERKKRSPLLAVAKSGTVALELALEAIPSLIVYPLSLFDYFIAKFFLKISLPFYSLPNIILKKELFPEFIGHNLEEKQLFATAAEWISKRSLRDQCRSNCNELRSILESENPSRKAARSILSLLT